MKATISMNNEKLLDAETIITDNNRHSPIISNDVRMRGNRSNYIYIPDSSKIYKFAVRYNKLSNQLKHTKRYRIKKKIQKRINKLKMKELILMINENDNYSDKQFTQDVIKLLTMLGITVVDAQGYAKSTKQVLNELSQKWKSTL